MTPIIENNMSSPWMRITEKLLLYVKMITQGSSEYKAHAGVYVALNQVYYVRIEGCDGGKLVVTNPPEPGQKKKVKQVKALIEPDLVYPLIRGRDVKKWYVEFKDRYIIVPHDPKTGKPLPENDLKIIYPDTYSYLNLFREELKRRGIKPFLSPRDKLKKAKTDTEKKLSKEN